MLELHLCAIFWPKDMHFFKYFVLSEFYVSLITIQKFKQPNTSA